MRFQNGYEKYAVSLISHEFLQLMISSSSFSCTTNFMQHKISPGFSCFTYFIPYGTKWVLLIISSKVQIHTMWHKTNPGHGTKISGHFLFLIWLSLNITFQSSHLRVSEFYSSSVFWFYLYKFLRWSYRFEYVCG